MKKILKMIVLLAMAAGITSCVKDSGYDDGLYGINKDAEKYKIVNIPSANTTLTTSSSYKIVDGAKTQTIPVHLSAKDPASESLSVSLKVDADNAKIDAYNATVAVASRYTRMPTTGYTIGNASLATIPAGSRDGSVPVTINVASLPVGRYILPLSITGVDKEGYTISGNQGYRLILVIVTN